MTKLSASQKKAVRHTTGPAMVLAGPGSGKTTVIAHRVHSLIDSGMADPARILVITFTRAASASMKKRFLALGDKETTPVVFGTFHAVFFQILRHAYGFTARQIIPEEERGRIILTAAAKRGLRDQEGRELLMGLSGEISLVKNEQIEPEFFYSGVCSDEIFREIYAEYCSELKARSLIDYDDMLVLTRDLFLKRKDILAQWQKRFEWILVDEFQDINLLQYQILKMLALPENNLFVVGDDDQSIYRFRGAKPELMLGFPKDYPKAAILYLKENYRSTGGIVSFSGKVISCNKRRFEKKIHAVRGDGMPPDIFRVKTAYEESLLMIKEIRDARRRGISFGQIAILTRTNTGGRYAAEKLMEFEIPFMMEGGMPNLYDHWIAADILTYIRLGLGSRQRRDFLRVMNKPLRYISRDMLEGSIVSFDRLRMLYEEDEKDWMIPRLDQMEEDLAAIGSMKPFAAVNFIRFGIGYQQYLEEYALNHRIDPDELTLVAGELQEQAGSFKTFGEWSDHIMRYQQEMEEQRKKAADRPASGNADAVTIATLHSAKGLEFDTVILPDLNEGILPWHKAALEADMEEERRLFYVGITRAKNRLVISCVKERYGKAMNPSRFLEGFI